MSRLKAKITVSVDNKAEIIEYAKRKGLQPAAFARFAMAHYMERYPLRKAAVSPANGSVEARGTQAPKRRASGRA